MEPDPGMCEERGLRAAVLAGDEEAWQVLYERCFAPLEAFVRARGRGDRALLEEVVQESWMVAVRRIRRFDPARGTFLAWLLGIAERVLANQLRRQHSAHRRVCGADVQELCSPPAAEDRSARIALVLAGLPERYCAVLRAKYLERRSVAEIAGAWAQSPKAVESLLTRARRAFRRIYERIEAP